MLRPQEGQIRFRCFSSSMCFLTPVWSIVQPKAMARATVKASCGSGVIWLRPSSRIPVRMRMRLEVQLATSPIGYVRVELGRGEVGVTQHLLDAAEIGTA